VCYFLRIIADEQMRAAWSRSDSSDSSDSSNSSDNSSDDSVIGSSDGSDSEISISHTATENRARREQDHIKDARELFR